MKESAFQNQSRRMSSYRLPIPLSKEEEKICILCLTTKYKDEAREALILHNLRLVLYVADHFYDKFCTNNHVTKEELVSDGQFALVKAARTFSMDRETSFSTYAYRCIQNQMTYDLRNRKRQIDRLPFDDDRTKQLLEDIFEVQFEDDPVFEYVYQKIRKEKVCQAYETLDESEKGLLSYRYFVTDGDQLIPESGLGEKKKYKRNEILGYSQKDVSRALGLSQSYVARLEKNVLAKIKKKVNCGTIEVEKYRTKE